MSYQKQNFANGEVLTAPQLNHIENGIVDLESNANASFAGKADKSEVQANAKKISAESTRAKAAESEINETISTIIDPTLSVSGKAADAKAVGTIFDDVKAEKAEIDDSTVGLDAWSSKHIVDMLCPPLEETGNPVQCYPVTGYPLGCKASWEPTQEGTGDPSQENIRPISGRDSVTVERCGENLLEFLETNDQSSDISIVVDQQKVVTLNGTLTTKGNITIAKCRLHWRSGKEYTMRAKKISGAVNLGVGDGITYAFSLFSEGLTSFFRGPTNLTSFDEYTATQTSLEEIELVLMLQCWRENTVFNNYKFQIEVVPGSTAPASYSPYTGQTSTLTLPHTIYGGTVDAVTGEGQETWTAPFDFSEYEGGNRISKGMPGAGWAQSDDAVPWFVYDDGLFLNDVICDKLKYVDAITVHTTPYTIGTGYYWIAIRGPWATEDDVRNWLLQQKPMVSYKLATPEPFTATGPQPIPALIGVNTILTDADKLTVTGKADPIKRITDLEDAVASMT